MNKIIAQTEGDFQASIFKMSEEDHISLLRLLDRELSLTQEELKRSYNLLEISKEKRKNLEVFRYEQNVRDLEMEVEKLERKRSICKAQTMLSISNDKKTYVTTCTLTNGLSGVAPPQPKIISDEEDICETKLFLSTKKLINNFEKMCVIKDGMVNNSNQFRANPKFKNKQIFSSDPIIPANSRYAIQFQPTDSLDPLFADIKLRKIGLPLDAQEYDQNNMPNIVSNRKDDNKKSVDCSKPSEIIFTDKFHNPNKEIQSAIQTEIKEVKLKKTIINESPLMCSFDDVSMGRFDFSHEKNMSSNSLNKLCKSASKSMPFLNGMSSLNNIHDNLISDNIPDLNTAEASLNTNDGELSNSESSLKDWNPVLVLKHLYTIHKKSDEVPSMASTYSFHVDILYGPNNSMSWNRGYIKISKGQLNYHKDQATMNPFEILDLRLITVKLVQNDYVEIHDYNGLHSSLRCVKSFDSAQLLTALESTEENVNLPIVPHLYESIAQFHAQKVLIVDLGSCSVRAGLLKSEPTLPGLYFPHVAAVSKTSKDVIEIGFEAFDPSLTETCDIIRPLKPDTTFEHLAFTSGIVESTMTKICSSFGINSKEYIIMLSLPHNVSENTRSKLADILFQRLNFKGVGMCGESLLALHAYGEPTGLLVDVGCRTEILPVTDGVVQTTAVKRGIFGGHLMQVALSHLIPIELHSITDFLLVRLIMEEACRVAESNEAAKAFNKCSSIDLRSYKLPHHMQSFLILQGRDRTLPAEGLFNPEIYSIDTCGLTDMIKNSIQSCPIDFRKRLYRSICLSGAATQVNGLVDRLKLELKKGLPNVCEVTVSAAPDRAHFSYVGACFVASSEEFERTVVNRSDWENNRFLSLRRWHC